MKTKRSVEDPRTRFNLENYLRLMFHPTGWRRFGEGVNAEEGDKSPLSSVVLGMATAADIAKYIGYAAIIGQVIYDYLSK